ncbi:putative thioredoxin [Xylaria digitata]|nr:putative thioredoxin [Xylaria digitata]
MTNFSIDITSDPVCIWCYIGRKRLDKAIALYKRVYPNGRYDTFTVNWRAYYLDPSSPARGVPFEQRMLQKVTSSGPDPGRDPTDKDRELARHLKERLASLGRQEGLALSFEGKIGNTRSAHRAIAFSGTQRSDSPHGSESFSSITSVQDRFVMALFAAYFEGVADITSYEDLADVAESIGLSRAEMLAWLESGEGGEEVDEQDHAAKDAGLKGVPHFTVQGRRVDGSRDVQDFLELFVKIKEDGQEQALAIRADSRGAVEPGITA